MSFIFHSYFKYNLKLANASIFLKNNDEKNMMLGLAHNHASFAFASFAFINP